MEACGSAHYWARELTAMGHEVVLIPPAYIKPYVKRGKNDAVDAAAICEAMSRPNMRFVPVKSAEQQAVLMLHKTRDLLVKQRTMAVNALRGHLAEFGVVAAKGIGRVDELLALAKADAALPPVARTAVTCMAQHLEALDLSIGAVDEEIAKAHRQNPVSRLLDRDSRRWDADRVGDRGQRFRSGRVQVRARLRGVAWSDAQAKLQRRQGEARRHHQAGQSLHSQDARRRARRRCCASPASAKALCADWINALSARKPERLVAVALANKLARICWAIMTTGESFRTDTYVKA